MNIYLTIFHKNILSVFLLLLGLITSLNANNNNSVVLNAPATSTAISKAEEIDDPLFDMQLSFTIRHLLCWDDLDGKVTVHVEGGIPPYSYNWDTGAQTAAVGGLAVGWYRVTVTDTNGQTAEGMADVQAPEELQITAIYTEVSCGATNDAYMEVRASGGTAPYTYLWEMGGGGDRRENLGPGLYSVTITDANGCQAMICPEITQSVPPGLTVSVRDETCPGANDGRITVTPSGNSPPYRYEWSGGVAGDQNSTAFNLAPGTYTITVTNFRNCSSVAEATVGGGFGFSVTTNGATCGSSSNGQATVNIMGGTDPYTYNWSTGNTSASVNDLPPGTHTVMVTDANGCSGTQSVTITSKPMPSVTITTTDSRVCAGMQSSTATAIATGGEGDYTYQWSNGQNGTNITGLGEGNYTVTVTDANGCQASASIYISEMSPVHISEQITHVLCPGESTGVISITATGGSNNGFIYNWAHGTTGNVISGVTAGNYTVTVTDAAGCSASKTMTVHQPTPIKINVTTTNSADMTSNDGAISVSVSGGTPDYTYEWNNGSIAPSITNLAPGTYILTVTDANGCKQTTPPIIVEATCTLSASITTIRNVSCAGNDGSATVSVFGAKGNVTYSWSHGGNTLGIAGLAPGFYGVTVTDEEGCQYIAGAFIGEDCDCIEPVIENILVIEASCGQSNGSISLEMQEDNSKFNYRWSDPSMSGTGGKDLPSGTYYVTISDRNNPICATQQAIHVGNANIGPVVIFSPTPEMCNGMKGSVNLFPSNLEYTWEDGTTGGFRADLSAGEHFVTVTHPAAEGCQDIITVKIDLESTLSLNPIINQYPDCEQYNGSVTIEVEGGSGNYAYSWGSSATQSGLPAGTFNVSVMDNTTGCTGSATFSLSNNIAGVAIDMTDTTHVSCAGGKDGSVQFDIIETGDFIGPVTTIITDGLGRTYSSDALPAGNYCILAMDANECIAGQACFEITQPNLLLVDVSILEKSCLGNGSILLKSSGGNGNYRYDWADLAGDVDQRDRAGVENGTYSVTVSDDGGCSLNIDNILVTGECFICPLGVEATIHQQPSCGLPNGSVTITPINPDGMITYSWEGGASREDLFAGTYTVTITDAANDCTAETSFTLVEPELPPDAMISNLIVCPDAMGVLEYDVSNFKCEKQPISITITDSSGNIYDEKNLAAFENYIFVIKDADGVIVHSQEFSVDSYEPIITGVKLADEGCTILGAIDLDLSKSADNYTINWADLTGANNSADRTDLSEGTYYVTITEDATTCRITREYTINKDGDINASLAPVTFTCDSNPVQLDLQTDEPSEVESYTWTPANIITTGLETASPTVQIDSGEIEISVEITDKGGCTTTKTTKIVSVNTDPPANIATSPQCDGLTIDFSNDGLASAYYIWDFGDGNTSTEANPSHTYTSAGNYTISLRLNPNLPCATEKGILSTTNLELVEDARTLADFQINYDPCKDEGLIRFEDKSIANPGTITSWKWNFGNGISTNEQNPEIKIEKDAIMEVTLEITTSNNCNASTSQTGDFKFIKIPTLSESLTICPGIPTELNPGAQDDGFDFLWSPAELLDDPTAANPITTTFVPTDFMVKIKQGDCEADRIVRANVPPEQDYLLSEDEEVCTEEEVLITADLVSEGTIEWATDPDFVKIISNEPELMVAPGIYYFRLTDKEGCTVTDQVAIENLAIDAHIQDNVDLCTPESGTLVVINNSDKAITSYEWQAAAGIISTDLTTETLEVNPEEATEYTVILKNDVGCEAILKETVDVSDLEEVIALPQRDTIFKGEFTTIDILPAGDYTIEWDPNSTLNNPSSFNPTATPEETTTYIVNITDNKTGCTTTREVTIHVIVVPCGEPNVFFPNAFSPNDDGVNDILMVRGNAISQVHFIIYNRWGEKVFESNSQEVGWNGYHKGEKVAPDVYGYYLRVICLAGDEYITQGECNGVEIDPQQNVTYDFGFGGRSFLPTFQQVNLYGSAQSGYRHIIDKISERIFAIIPSSFIVTKLALFRAILFLF